MEQLTTHSGPAGMTTPNHAVLTPAPTGLWFGSWSCRWLLHPPATGNPASGSLLGPFLWHFQKASCSIMVSVGTHNYLFLTTP